MHDNCVLSSILFYSLLSSQNQFGNNPHSHSAPNHMSFFTNYYVVVLLLVWFSPDRTYTNIWLRSLLINSQLQFFSLTFKSIFLDCYLSGSGTMLLPSHQISTLSAQASIYGLTIVPQRASTRHYLKGQSWERPSRECHSPRQHS